MATIYKNITIAEGITSTNLYGRIDLYLKIDQFPKENKSKVYSEVHMYGENRNTIEEADGERKKITFAGSGSGIITVDYLKDNVVYSYGIYNEEEGTSNFTPVNKEYHSKDIAYNDTSYPEYYTYWLKAEESKTLKILVGEFTVTHEVDGTAKIVVEQHYNNFYDELDDYAKTTYTIKNSYNVIVDLPAYDRAVVPITADNFTDEGNPTVTYEAYTGNSVYYYLDTSQKLYHSSTNDTFAELQLGLSFDGNTLDIPYRDIPVGSTTYTMELTDAEREILRKKAQGADTVPIYYMIRALRDVYYLRDNTKYKDTIDSLYHETKEFISKTQRNLTIVGAYPTLNPTVKDIKEETIALTGDENTFVRYESMAEFAFNAVASKHAEIVSYSIHCGTKVLNDLSVGVIEDVESGNFTFNVVDSRAMQAQSTVFKNFVEYVKPTCYQKLNMEMSGEFSTRVVLSIEGNYYNGSFGAVDNSLLLQTRYKEGNGEFTDWITITDAPTFNGTTYSVKTTIEGFSYSKAYTFQCRAVDKLNTVQSAEYTLRIYPVFDWGENDFNFNVPVNINGSLSMDNEQIIRHNKAANNTVLSATGGKVYVRPNGSEDTYGELVVNSDGSVNMSGDLNVDGNITFKEFSIDGNTLADYVIETGEEAMGTNGTWYWRKWASGKSEAWGCRNFGNMAVTTTWGNLYRSAVFTQDLPEKVFIRTPDSININIVHSNYGGWICKHEQTAPSAVTTGSFIFVRPASATVSPTNIGFYIVGEWK